MTISENSYFCLECERWHRKWSVIAQQHSIITCPFCYGAGDTYISASSSYKEEYNVSMSSRNVTVGWKVCGYCHGEGAVDKLSKFESASYS